MYKSLIDNFGVKPDVSSWLYAEAYLKAPIHKVKKNKKPNQSFWYRGRLWVPLSCAIAIADSGNAHVGLAGDGPTSNINTTGASLLVGLVAGSGSGGIAPTDSKSNTWVGLTARVATLSNFARLFYVANPTVGTSHNFSPPSSIFAASCWVAFTGVTLSSPFDQENGLDSATDPTSQPGSITPSVNGCVVVAGLGGTSTAGVTINGSYTFTDQVPFAGGANFSGCLAFDVQTTATATNPTFTWTNAIAPGQAYNAAVIANFKPAAGATTSLKLNSLLNGLSASGPFFRNPLGYPVH